VGDLHLDNGAGESNFSEQGSTILPNSSPIPCDETNHQLNTRFCDCLRAGSRPALHPHRSRSLPCLTAGSCSV